MEKPSRLDHDDASSLTTFNIIVEGDGEGLISKIFSKFKTAVSGPQQSTSPSSSTRTISIVLSNESGMILEDVNNIAENQKLTHTISGESIAPTSASSIKSSTTATHTIDKRPQSIVTASEVNVKNVTTPVIITKAPSTAPTSSSSKSTIKHIVIDEDQNQQQEILYPPPMLIPLTKTSSCDSDTQSVMTTFSVSNTNSLSRILNRLRGESMDSNKDFWMPDEQCRECFDCNAPFNIFRRKHHCRT
ncbi:uncharacterized protein EV154DRAFT_185139 [Mucor mucedo]|uniref:uncharacterized protein n=1 Tax=Mucor mucedo TaxID=29922 RepID=UPI00222010A6|nr:uncharacterized protein EV154DRAFT_185139 [Mucor mucedo]KAI7892594.1 hypothetical protein EV154DRAFT_185139 [Mucor mucedo]